MIAPITKILLTAKDGEVFVFPYRFDIPIRTCKKYFIELKVKQSKKTEMKVVQVIRSKTGCLNMRFLMENFM